MSAAALSLLTAFVALAASLESGLYVDATGESGLDFVHWSGVNGELYYAEMMGPAGALFDYDGDGDLDVFLAQGAALAPAGAPAPLLPLPPGGLGHRLYRNDLVATDGRTVPRLRDLAAASGAAGNGAAGMAVATGDVDGDGLLDLFVGAFGPDQLLHNRGDGRFEDWTARSGVGDPRWAAAATFFDADGDDRLDLYVARYVDFDPARNVRCYAETSRRDYCGPHAFPPVPDSFFHNRGDGRFEDWTARSGFGAVAAPGLGVVAADLDADGRTDLYVANDGKPNFLFLNRGDGTFREDALFSGAALDAGGRPQASMGLAVGDLDDDGDLDLYVTHIAAETDALYVNDGRGLFVDRSLESGLGRLTLPATSFGAEPVDVDLDGRLDLVVTSGAVRILEAQAAAGEAVPLAEPGALWRQRPQGGFEDWRERGGTSFSASRIGRVLAVGDVDADGLEDLLLAPNNGPARLLRRRPAADAWVGVRALEATGGDALGAVVTLTAGGRRRLRHVHTDGSFASARDPRIVVGLAETAGPLAVEVGWPGGRRRRLVGLRPGRTAVVPAVTTRPANLPRPRP